MMVVVVDWYYGVVGSNSSVRRLVWCIVSHKM